MHKLQATELQKEAIDRVCFKRQSRMKYLFFLSDDEVEDRIERYIRKLKEKFIF